MTRLFSMFSDLLTGGLFFILGLTFWAIFRSSIRLWRMRRLQTTEAQDLRLWLSVALMIQIMAMLVCATLCMLRLNQLMLAQELQEFYVDAIRVGLLF